MRTCHPEQEGFVERDDIRIFFEQATPEVIAAVIAEEVGRKVVQRDVEHDGVAAAAARIAELI